MNTASTGLILKDIGNFSMKNFEGRLILQKTIYLLKSFGVDLGYTFNWYWHGTYSPDLSKAGFELEGMIDEIPDLPVKFEGADVQSNYEKFLKFIDDKKTNADLLEISSSICYMYKIKIKKERILELVENKKPRFTAEPCKQMWKELEMYGVISS